MTTTIQPKGDHVLVEVIEEETIGTIVIPEKARGNLRDAITAKVIAVGPGRISEYGAEQVVTSKEGDLVLMPRHVGTEIEVARKKYRIVRDVELLGTVEESRIVMPASGGGALVISS